jgi:regulator of protease activity HflC (stomatin/prohibitin superfamily)
MSDVVLGLLAVIACICITMGLHQVPEGHMGVYWRGGALLSTATEAGFHTKIPLVTRVHYVQYTMQTDEVTNIPCGTRGGVMIYFEKIEVVNRLKKELLVETVRNFTTDYDKLWIFDRVHHEINQLCSSKTLEQVYITEFGQLDELLSRALTTDIFKNAPGVEIVTVRVTKPRIPEGIRRNYEQMEVKRTMSFIKDEERKVVAKLAETEKLRATIEAQKRADVSAIQMRMAMQTKLASQKIAKIEDDMLLARERGIADAKLYS